MAAFRSTARAGRGPHSRDQVEDESHGEQEPENQPVLSSHPPGEVDVEGGIVFVAAASGQVSRAAYDVSGFEG